MNRPTRYEQILRYPLYLHFPLKIGDMHHRLKDDLILETKLSSYDFFVESPTDINSIPSCCFINLQGSITKDPQGNL